MALPLDRAYPERRAPPTATVTSGYVWLTIGAAQLVLAVAVTTALLLQRSRRHALATMAATAASGGLEAARLVSRTRSRLWWHRVAAARALAAAADEHDRAVVVALVADPHPAVQCAAAAVLARGQHCDDDLVARIVDGLASRPSAVRAAQVAALAGCAERAEPVLVRQLRADAPAHKLYAYIYAAGVVGTPACRARVAELSTHPHPEVRIAVARALKQEGGRGWGGDGPARTKLLSMLRDPDWRVRAQAARGLAGARAGTGEPDAHAVQELARALTDATWWVRFRAALALAGLGAAGRAALDAARTLPDRYARDMATLVTELPDATIEELAAG